MLAVVEDDSNTDPAVPAKRAPSLIDKHAKECKLASFELYSEINEVLNAAIPQQMTSCSIDVETLQRWKAKAKQCNQSLKVHIATMVDDKYRSCADMHLLKFAMKADILDRESAFTEAMEIMSGKEIATDLNDQALRALRMARVVNSGVSELETPEAFDADAIIKCLSICGDEDHR